jgi:hypothetical protein
MKLKLYRPAENGGCWGIVLAIGTWLNIDIAIAAPRAWESSWAPQGKAGAGHFRRNEGHDIS